MSRILREGTKKAGLNKRITPHMLRYSFAIHLLEHKSTKTTEIYTHVSKKSFANIKSPLDRI
ncbi:MAG: hypothetical protein GX820_09445, partial [Bacteroidales bacterium]|nr:hypothetical protein [Bacteroidales bacterium]